MRLVRFWVSFDFGTEENETDSFVARVSSLSFSEMRRLSSVCDFKHLGFNLTFLVDNRFQNDNVSLNRFAGFFHYKN